MYDKSRCNQIDCPGRFDPMHYHNTVTNAPANKMREHIRISRILVNIENYLFDSLLSGK